MDLTHHDSTFRNLRIAITTRMGFEKMNLALRCGRRSCVSSVRSRNITVPCLLRSLYLDGSYGQRREVRRRARALLLGVPGGTSCKGIPAIIVPGGATNHLLWRRLDMSGVLPFSFIHSWRLSAKCAGALKPFPFAYREIQGTFE